MKNTNYYIVGIGEALIDCFSKTKRKLGGAPTIFAYHAAQAIGKGMVISAVGNDAVGTEILQEINKHNLEWGGEIIYDKPSGEVKVDNRDKNNPKYSINKESAWSAIPYTEKLKGIAKKTRAVYFGTLASFCGETTKNTINNFLEIVPRNCLKIFDVNWRKNPDGEDLYTDDLLRDYLEMCNVLKVNTEELYYLGKILHIEGGERKLCREIMNRYKRIKYLILTMGEDGSSIFWRDKDHDNKLAFSALGMPVNVKNTVGAGDALAGAFIGEILRKKSPVHAHRIAVQRSTIVCKMGDSMPNIIRPDIFISYSRKDELIVADYFCECFEERGWSVWRDKNGIHHGDHFPMKIEQAIRNCDVVVYFSSKNSNKSNWVTREIKFARENGKTVIPIKLDAEPFNKTISTLLKNIQEEDFALTKLIDSIEKQLKS